MVNVNTGLVGEVVVKLKQYDVLESGYTELKTEYLKAIGLNHEKSALIKEEIAKINKNLDWITEQRALLKKVLEHSEENNGHTYELALVMKDLPW